ncbi:MAG TPA: hypothetical protein DDW52_16640 [Planctomycetaceae bacterium]|nr:hypothetical protein [Planctomycetaceae bacterium]
MTDPTKGETVTVREFTKRFEVPSGVAMEAIRDLYQCVNTFNRRKFGRKGRGMVMITGLEGSEIRPKVFEVVVRFATGRPALAKVVGSGRFQMYRLEDFQKPLRKLAVADLSRKNRRASLTTKQG